VADKQVRLYFHGLLPSGDQQTRVALSSDGLNFEVRPPLLGPSYMRVFRHQGAWGALAMPGRLMRSADGLTPFEDVAEVLPVGTRHSAILIRGAVAHVFWTRVGDAPERIHHGQMRLDGPWRNWRIEGARELLRPERSWEGPDHPVEPSRVGEVTEPVNQLRDPGVFEHNGAAWLIYAVAGERGLGLAQLSGL
jgi:hypothetical protein